MANIFTRNKEVKELREETERLKENVALLEKKGYYPSDEEVNKNNEYLKRILQEAQRIIYFDNFHRDDYYDTYRSNVAVFGIVDRIAKAVGELGGYLELQDKNNKVIEGHPLMDLLRQPNDRFNLKRFLYAWTTNYLVFGDAFVYFAREEAGKNKGAINAMYVMQGNKIVMVAGDADKPIKGVLIRNTVNNMEIKPDDYLQSFIYNIDETDKFGFSPLAAAAYDCSLIKKGKERLNTSLTNGGVANIIAPAPTKDGSLPSQVGDSLETDLNKQKNNNKNMVVKQAIEVHPLGSTPADLSILSTDKNAVTALCFAYGIPVDLYYGQAKYQNAKEAKKALYETAAIPLINTFAEDIMGYLRRTSEKTKVLKGAELDYSLVLNTDDIDVLKVSVGETLDNLKKMYASLNELRAAWGYPPIEEAYANEPMLPIGTLFGSDMVDINENATQ